MSKFNNLENSFLLLYFNATTIADLAEDDTTSPATTIDWSLATGDPGEAGDLATSEATYTSYVRKTVARTGGGHAVSTNSMSPVADVEFVEATGGSETITHFSVGPTAAGDVGGYFGTVTPNVVVSSGVLPILTTATTITED